MPRRLADERLRKVSLTISIPEYLAEHLEDTPRSEIIGLLLEENAERILGGDVERASRYREAMLMERINKLIRTHRLDFSERLLNTKRLNTYLSKLEQISEQISDLKKELRDIEQEVKSIISDLKRLRHYARNDLNRTIKELIEELREEIRL
ncbi:hypothetical protein DRN52_06835 [Thermococci archaeon]|nr:MAG: hypothetical protein DRN52_06835 [Thermococci archaeon]